MGLLLLAFLRLDWPRLSVSAGPNKKLPPPVPPGSSRAPLPPCTGSNPSRQSGALPQWKRGTGAAGGTEGGSAGPAGGPAGCPFWSGGAARSVPETSRPEFLVTSPVPRLGAEKVKPKCAWKTCADGLRARSTPPPICPHLASMDVTPTWAVGDRGPRASSPVPERAGRPSIDRSASQFLRLQHHQQL
ncbi:hypothetical protein GQ55_2G279100 [Panicum hallii var. hallii]|uniref:Uncharacterized protein n=1 Tax=Panicum hallii var. hallii TaxID=1504633 RepID=A0A2T7ET37_9POAL|nr:hypothetical protein GQ55_2G279100 [Panicum hallii var. hallii]